MTVTYLNNIAFADVFVLYSYMVCASLCFRNNIIACAESLLQPRHCATLHGLAHFILITTLR